ncbi:hypothetical protein EJ05DRAFT_346089 [Pseudovirgaria hyperparasitica]|uniref:Uncharacterized protein n=1 Tax=Pseudovirgaria hyperparasitica TaxID=470096 RepID=A0A6A6VRM5_9PEZI|nr:uncharacterized protein EJ05DRAFT_346089 [Pseudovirgaria hyperparasitica]KAF2752436.1 hypothetical protein EJ05DRAFT_346089 [Pseudovirgaria hyperparasitica]
MRAVSLKRIVPRSYISSHREPWKVSSWTIPKSRWEGFKGYLGSPTYGQSLLAMYSPDP